MLKFRELNGNFIHETAIICNGVELGEGNIIYPYAVIGVRGFQRGNDDFEGAVIIGNNNKIGAHTSIMHDTIIGDNNLIMNYCNVGHDVRIGNDNEIGVGTTIGGYTVIGHRNMIKLACTIRNRVTIGDDCLLGMRSNVVAKVVESGSRIMGNPAK